MSVADFDVIVCGSLHLDVMVRAPGLPRLDETAVGSAWGMKCGGKGGNQAVMASRAGARTAMIGRVGADDFGRRLRANLDEAEVDRKGVLTDATAGSGMSVAIVNDTGGYGAVIVSGANRAIPPEEAAEAWRRMGGAAILVLQNEVPEAVNVAVAAAARIAGARTILNAAPARPLGPDLLNLIDVLVVNRVEAEMMAGVPVTDASAAIAALPRLGSGARDVIVTLGGEGAVVASPGREPWIINAHQVTVVSTHGAGDCFVGTLAAALAQGFSLPTAGEIANRAAANFVSAAGELEAGSRPGH